MKLVITKPDGTTRTRVFADRAEAAEFGVQYYLVDDCYAPRTLALIAASQFAATGTAITGGYTFTEQAQ